MVHGPRAAEVDELPAHIVSMMRDVGEYAQRVEGLQVGPHAPDLRGTGVCWGGEVLDNGSDGQFAVLLLPAPAIVAIQIVRVGGRGRSKPARHPVG